jgi:hypothetical protein
LDVTPTPKRQPYPKHINLKIDATYFGRWGCSIVFKVGKNVIFWHFCLRETFREYLYCFSKLVELNYVILSVTSDKHGYTTSSVKYAFPNIPHQLCLVHIQNRCQSLLTKKPDTKAGCDLLELVRYINKIGSTYEKQIFFKWVDRYEKRYALFLNQRTYAIKPNGRNTWWYTHKNVRKAFVHIKSSIPNMFFYLEDTNIPKDTNGLEAEFTHLKTKLNIHRGLKRERRVNFISWYWYQKPTQNVY